jgi:hypothetical protein
MNAPSIPSARRLSEQSTCDRFLKYQIAFWGEALGLTRESVYK